MTVIDLHQHLWPAPLVEALRDRTHAPYLRGWTITTAGEPASELRPVDHDVARRIALDDADGIDLACVSLSAPLGIEALPPDEAQPLLDAWHDGAVLLPGHFAPWASVGSVEPDLDGLRSLLEGPFVGLQLPATSLADPEAWLAAGEVLRVAEATDRAVLVHPGPSPTVSGGRPGWWAPVVDYTAQLQAAWWAWHALDGRAHFPGLRVVFVAGAGLAPLQHERLAARGGRTTTVDPDLYVDTSSYGPQALDGLIRALGLDVLVLGSDRPYAEPLAHLLDDAATRLVRVDNPRRALGARLGVPTLEGVA